MNGPVKRTQLLIKIVLSHHLGNLSRGIGQGAAVRITLPGILLHPFGTLIYCLHDVGLKTRNGGKGEPNLYLQATPRRTSPQRHRPSSGHPLWQSNQLLAQSKGSSR